MVRGPVVLRLWWMSSMAQVPQAASYEAGSVSVGRVVIS